MVTEMVEAHCVGAGVTGGGVKVKEKAHSVGAGVVGGND